MRLITAFLIMVLGFQPPFEYKWPELKVVPSEHDLRLQVTKPVTTAVDQTKIRRLLYFTATWCGPCRDVQAPVLDKMAKASKPWIISSPGRAAHIWKYDFDANYQTRESYNVTQVPTFILVDGNGKELHRVVGCQTNQQLADLYSRKDQTNVPKLSQPATKRNGSQR